MDFHSLGNVNIDSFTEKILLELSAILNSYSINYPNIDFCCVADKISELLVTMSNMYEKTQSLILKNDELYCKNLELDLYLENFKKEKLSELNESFNFQDCVIEKNECLTKELDVARVRVADLKSQLNKLNKENMSLRYQADDTSNKCNTDEVCLKEKVLESQKSTNCLINKLEQAHRVNNDLLREIESLKKQISCTKNSSVSKWLDDATIQAYFTTFNQHPLTTQSNSLFIDPSVSEMFKNEENSTVNKHLNDLRFYSYDYVFFSVSNSMNKISASGKVTENHDEGSHWSLLFCDVVNKIAYHLDSLNDLNDKSAKALSNKLGFVLKTVACYQQNNNFECGLDVIINAKSILHYYCFGENKKCDFAQWFGHCTLVKHGVSNISDVETTNCDMLKEAKDNSSVIPSRKLALSLKRVDGDKWEVVKSNKCKIIPTPSKHSTQPVLSNRFSVLSDLSSAPSPTVHSPLKPRNPRNPSKRPSKKDRFKHVQIPKQKNTFRVTLAPVKVKDTCHVQIYSDSHGRGLSCILKDKLKSNYSVSSIVKPNAKMAQVLDGIDYNKALRSQDIIVLMAGTNDFENTGRCNGFTDELDSFLDNTSNSKIILVGLPSRHDLPSLNPTVADVNNELLTLSHRHKHVSFVSLQSLTRQSFTKRGLHLNLSGKSILANLLLESMNKFEIPIPSQTDQPPVNLSSRTLINKPNYTPPPVHQLHHQSPTSTRSRSFFNTRFLGEALKPPGVPWTLYLKRGLGVDVEVLNCCTKT